MFGEAILTCTPTIFVLEQKIRKKKTKNVAPLHPSFTIKKRGMLSGWEELEKNLWLNKNLSLHWSKLLNDYLIGYLWQQSIFCHAVTIYMNILS